MTDKPKRPRDGNQLAKFIVDMAVGDEPEHDPDTSAQISGGKRGGRSRSVSLSDAEKKNIARKAARERWKKDPAVRVTKEQS